MDAESNPVSSCDPSEGESSEHEDADARVENRCGESSDVGGSGCGSGSGSVPAASDRDDEETAASDGSDWTHVSAGSRSVPAMRICPEAAQSHRPEPSVTEDGGENMSPDAITTGECDMTVPRVG